MLDRVLGRQFVGESRDLGLPAPPRFLHFGQLWARKAARIFLVGLSPGRRDVQKSTGRPGAGQGEGEPEPLQREAHCLREGG